MINSQEELQPTFNKMKLFMTFDFIPKLLRCITFYIGNCIDKVVHYQKDVITRRLKRRKKRLFEGCNYRGKNIKCKCDCNRCTKYRNIHSRVLETGFMTNVVCNNRPNKNEILNTTIDNNIICCTDKGQVRPWTLEQTQPQDHRDVKALDRTDGWAWWTKMQQSAARMPLLQHDTAMPTKSVCSSSNSCSYFDSCNTLTELNEELDEVQTDNSTITEVISKFSKHTKAAKCSQSPYEVSKSDSKIEFGRDKNRPSNIFKSASTKTMYVRRPTNGRKNFALTKRNFIKRRLRKTNYRIARFDGSKPTVDMADKEKKKKTKKKEEAAPAAPPPEPEPAPAEEKPPTPTGTPKESGSTRASSRGSRRAKRSGSSVFSMFTQKQVAEFKEAFQLMDHDKDGIIGKNDLRMAFDSVGRLATDKEIDEMLNEAPAPINFTQLLNLFAVRMSGSGADDDDVVTNAFSTFDENGKIDGERLRHALMTYGDKFTAKEVDESYDHMYIDDKGFIDTQSLIAMLTGTGEEEED
ncbi:myosin regulatory light chain 2 [Vespula squamosa]|uniref:Myosin regulatory light chain 2 n=1 Tax=Vespula squamosa TaxID=30214 RepID=A0ABD2BRH5_VESSQ